MDCYRITEVIVSLILLQRKISKAIAEVDRLYLENPSELRKLLDVDNYLRKANTELRYLEKELTKKLAKCVSNT